MPVDEVFATRDSLRVAEDLRPAMWRGSKPYDVRPMADGLVVGVVRLMIKGSVDGHGSHCVCDCDQRFAGLGVLRAKNVS